MNWFSRWRLNRKRKHNQNMFFPNAGLVSGGAVVYEEFGQPRTTAPFVSPAITENRKKVIEEMNKALQAGEISYAKYRPSITDEHVILLQTQGPMKDCSSHHEEPGTDIELVDAEEVEEDELLEGELVEVNKHGTEIEKLDFTHEPGTPVQVSRDQPFTEFYPSYDIFNWTTDRISDQDKWFFMAKRIAVRALNNQRLTGVKLVPIGWEGVYRVRLNYTNRITVDRS